MWNARLLVADTALRQALFPIPVITLFWTRQCGMSLADVMLSQAVFALTATVFELPSGYLADRVGYRQSLLVAALLWLAGWAQYAFAASFAQVIAAEIVLGMGLAFASGANSALLYVSLEEAGAGATYTRWEGRLQAAGQTSEALSSLVGGYLYALAPRLPMWLQVPAALGGLGVALALRREPRPAPGERVAHGRRVLHLVRHALAEHARLRTAIALSVVLSLSSFVLVWLIQPYMAERGVPEAAFGPIWAAANLWVGVVGLGSHRLAATLGMRPTLFGCCLLVAAGYALLAATAAWWGFAFYFLIMTLRGVQIPLLRQVIQEDAPADDRATVLSLNALLFRLAFVVGGPLVGVLLSRFALSTVLWLLGGAFSTLALAALAAFGRAHGRGAPLPRAA